MMSRKKGRQILKYEVCQFFRFMDIIVCFKEEIVKINLWKLVGHIKRFFQGLFAISSNTQVKIWGKNEYDSPSTKETCDL